MGERDTCFLTESSSKKLATLVVRCICKIRKLQERLHLWSECDEVRYIAQRWYSGQNCWGALSRRWPIRYCPVKVYENCFYRAISKAIFGHEERHVELRVMTILELVKNSRKYALQAFYDKMCSHPTNVLQYVVETSVSDRSLVPVNFLKSIQNET